jgi:hypothetical protein
MLDRPDIEERDDWRVRTSSSSSSVAESRRVREPAVAERFEALRFGLSDSRERLLSCDSDLSMLLNHNHRLRDMCHTSLCVIAELIAISSRIGSRFIGIEVIQVARKQQWRVAVARHQARSCTVHEDSVVYIGCRICEGKQ